MLTPLSIFLVALDTQLTCVLELPRVTQAPFGHWNSLQMEDTWPQEVKTARYITPAPSFLKMLFPRCIPLCKDFCLINWWIMHYISADYLDCGSAIRWSDQPSKLKKRWGYGVIAKEWIEMMSMKYRKKERKKVSKKVSKKETWPIQQMLEKWKIIRQTSENRMNISMDGRMTFCPKVGSTAHR